MGIGRSANVKLVNVLIHDDGHNGCNYPIKDNHHTPKDGNNLKFMIIKMLA
jgi:hypothetical protein